MERKRQIDELPRFCFPLNWTAIAMRESYAALEGDKLSQIDNGEFPLQAIELSARRDLVLPIRKHAGKFPCLHDGDGRVSPIGHPRCKSALCSTGRIPQLVFSKRTSIHRVIESPSR
ncbi:MAG: hypothetical protein ABSD72_16510 [Terracidiphilus sp.]